MRNPQRRLHLLLESLVSLLLISWFASCIETDTITKALVLEDPDTIVSRGEIYLLGFFNPENSTNRYLGIWNNVSETSIIWVSNRNKPLIPGSSGIVTISEDGNLVLIQEKEILWSSNVTNPVSNASAQLLDTGNLVLRDNSNGNIMWESFSHPADAFVPTMKITENLITGNRIALTSWKSYSDPDIGNFTAGLQAYNIPQIFIWNGKQPHWRSGPWNGLILTGVTDMYAVYLDGYSITRRSDGTVSFTRDYYGNLLMKVILKPNGTFIQTMWDVSKRDWNVTWVAPIDACDVYGVCGRFGNCNMRNSPMCSCLKGYEPVNNEEWRRGNWSSGCRRSITLQCDRSNNLSDSSKEDRFSKLSNTKVPDFMEVTTGILEEGCQSVCLRRCSCIAYSYDPGIGCMFWSDNLTDVRQFPSGGTDLYIRVAYSVIGEPSGRRTIIIASVVPGVAAVILVLGFVLWKTKKIGTGRKGKKSVQLKTGEVYKGDSCEIVLIDDMGEVSLDELPFYSFEMLADATGRFDQANLLGKGGFGPVYKGILANGKEIAVKRLSRVSGQGMQEFMNEVLVISKLQHRNLVSLLGCCAEKEEKILVYEFMANKSLDLYLFDKSQRVIDWKQRFEIMEGIGRGLLYLHRDSRLRIIHRDLKASNVLLDENWNPKISDFGMARIFGGRADEANTARVVGTYGYMAPEYAMGGVFSEKSDVFSFGVMVLEIISGRRNMSFHNDDDDEITLLEHAWKSWNEGNFENFADERISRPEFWVEIIRCVHIGLLCVQEFPTNRPMISKVLSMLANEVSDLPVPQRPVFTKMKPRDRQQSSTSQSQTTTGSLNNITITMLEGR